MVVEEFCNSRVIRCIYLLIFDFLLFYTVKVFKVYNYYIILWLYVSTLSKYIYNDRKSRILDDVYFLKEDLFDDKNKLIE